ncbi:Glutaredoxin [Virgibacillus subterraneus]|uniref:Glutaredoxin n=2 Tax=Virgibacillus TaxID=84406 RepID=A0A1H1FYM4_9BACI|nr:MULTISPECIES: glutaredoxin family protein [Virgibacillus]SDR06062.1 Glutaredoxin [Virgibacillus salinus]SEQ77420.1 Glutaredoxin [Virgibacillus subterraneus]
MNDKEVIVYISNDCLNCEKLLSQLKQWKIKYTTRNVTENQEYIKQLHERDVFGTPTTLVDDQVICGFQINKIKYLLGMSNNHQPYFSSFYDCYSSQSSYSN